MSNKELRINILENLLRAVMALSPVGGTYIEDHVKVSKVCEDEEAWLDMCSSLCDLLHDFV